MVILEIQWVGKENEKSRSYKSFRESYLITFARVDKDRGNFFKKIIYIQCKKKKKKTYK
jgi:hypothetical protein